MAVARQNHVTIQRTPRWSVGVTIAIGGACPGINSNGSDMLNQGAEPDSVREKKSMHHEMLRENSRDISRKFQEDVVNKGQL